MTKKNLLLYNIIRLTSTVNKTCLKVERMKWQKLFVLDFTEQTKNVKSKHLNFIMN